MEFLIIPSTFIPLAVLLDEVKFKATLSLLGLKPKTFNQLRYLSLSPFSISIYLYLSFSLSLLC